MLLQVGVVRMALLASPNGSKTKTLYLPPPDRDGLTLEWEKKATTKELINGGERTRLRGFLPVLTAKWTGYDEQPSPGYTIGTDNGQRPGLESLLWFLSRPSGLIRISPGITAGGFSVDSMTVKPIGKKGLIYTGLQVTFRGRDAFDSMTLEAF